MIKECKVVLRNAINMVVMFDDIEIQMPSDNTKSVTIFVKNEDGKYSLSTESEYEKSLKVVKTKSKTEKKELEIKNNESNELSE